ncbi:MAG: alpha/beta fold hydrolase [Quisquiliibacterium sp.]
MLEVAGMKKFRLPTSETGVQIEGRIGGSGSPLLLLHGNPLSQNSWNRILPQLMRKHTVVTTDLRGYGDSSKPQGLPDHTNYSFRRMGQDQFEVMRALGFERFALAGHDRGARVAYRMALDAPDLITKVAFLDILPTHYVFHHITADMAVDLYHWFFMAQPKGFPERLLGGHEAFYIRDKLMKQGPGKGGFTEEEIVEYIRVCTPENIHAVCEDYRAAASIDLRMDTADLEAGRLITVPTMVLWGERSHTALRHSPREVWPMYCSRIESMIGLPCGHYPTEQAPNETWQAFDAFF